MDPAAPARQHQGQHRPRANDRSAEVDIDRRPPVVHVVLAERPERTEGAGVVHEDVDGAEIPKNPMDRARHLIRIGDAGGERGRLAPGSRDDVNRFVQFLARAAEHRDAPSCLRHMNGNRPADPPPGARHEEDAILKVVKLHANSCSRNRTHLSRQFSGVVCHGAAG